MKNVALKPSFDKKLTLGIAKKKKRFSYLSLRSSTEGNIQNASLRTDARERSTQIQQHKSYSKCFPLFLPNCVAEKKTKKNPKVEPVNSRRRSVTASKDSLLKRDEMLFVLVVCFAVGDICNVHHCSDTENISEAADCSHR